LSLKKLVIAFITHSLILYFWYYSN